MVRTQDGDRDGATVAAYDIARLAGVGRAAVSNWRRRYPDFPKPVGGSAASPLYALSEVREWLARHGRRFQLAPGDRVWQHVRGTVPDLQLGGLIADVCAFLVFHRRAPQRWRTLSRRGDDALAAALPAAVRRAVPELPGEFGPLDPERVRVLRTAADAAGEQDHREIVDLLHQRYVEIHGRRQPVTPPPVAELMVDLSAAGSGTVLDPACGVGALLLAAHDRGAQTLLGQEVDPTAARLATARLLLHDAPVEVAVGDSLAADASPDRLVDAVVCDPPYVERSWPYDELVSDPRWEYGLPPRGEPELAWVQHCLSHVRPGGYAAVTMPSGAAGRRAGRRIRGNLLRAGALRAVVSLPGTGPGGAAPPDVWVLRRPAPGDPAPSHVLLIDTAGGSLADAAAAWRAFLADPEQPASATARAVRVIDLLDDEVDVSPARHLARPVAVDSRGFRTARAALRDVVERLAASLPDLDEADDAGPPAAEVTLGELVRAGAVTLHQAPLRMTVDNGETPVLTVRDVRQGRPPSGRTTVDAGTVLLQPGDVVTPVVAREPAVLVVTEPGAALGPQLHLLRPDPQRLDPHFLAGYLRVAQSLGGQRGSLASRSDVHRLTLPRLPLSRQRRYGEVFRQLAEFEETARQAGALAEALVRQGLAGLAVGALRPGQRARRRGGGAR
ncbi:MAG: N-6 DNA methylase [Micromonosporaceae bacterium]